MLVQAPHLESRCSRSFCLFSLPLGASALRPNTSHSSQPLSRPRTERPQRVISTAQKGKQNLDLLHSATDPPGRMNHEGRPLPLCQNRIFPASFAAKCRHGKDFDIWTKDRALTQEDLSPPLLSAWETGVELDGNGWCHSSCLALLRGRVKTTRDRPDGLATLSCPTPRNGLLLEGLIPEENEKSGLTEVKPHLTPRPSYSILGMDLAELKSKSTKTLYKNSPGSHPLFTNAPNWEPHSTGVPDR